jgi:hypothetical protein
MLLTGLIPIAWSVMKASSSSSITFMQEELFLGKYSILTIEGRAEG